MTLRQTMAGAAITSSSPPSLASYTPGLDKQDDRVQDFLKSAQELVDSHRRQQEKIAKLEKQDRASKRKIDSLKKENAKLREALRHSTTTTCPTDAHHASSELSGHRSKIKVPYGFQVRPPSQDKLFARSRPTTGKVQEEQAAIDAARSSEHSTLVQAKQRDLAPANVPRKVTYGFQVRAPTDDKVVPDARPTQGRTAKRPVAVQRAVNPKHHTPNDGPNTDMRAVNKNLAEHFQRSQHKAVPYGFNVRARSDDKLGSDTFLAPDPASTKRVGTQKESVGEQIARLRAVIR